MSGHSSELGQYWQAVRNRLWLVILVTIIAVGAAYVAIGRRPARYVATARMMVTSPVVVNPPTVLPREAMPVFNRYDNTVGDIMALIDSRPIATRVAKRMGMAGPHTVQRAITAAPERGTSLVRITATTNNAERSASLANVASEEFIAYFREANRNSVSEVRRFVEDQMTQSRARLEQSERALQAYRERNRVISLSDVSGGALSAMRSAEVELDAANRARMETDARLTAARARFGREQPRIVERRATTENPTFRRYQTHIIELELRRAQMAQVYTPLHPRMEALNREIADVRNRLIAEARTMVGEEVTTTNPIHARLVADIVTQEIEQAAVSARVSALQSTLRRRQGQVAIVPAVEVEFNRLARENRIMEANYTLLSTRYQEILLRENEAGFSPASVQLVEAAVAPGRAEPSAFPRFGAAAGFAGLILGILAALLLESMDDRIRTAQDAERALGVPVLAQIPAHGTPRPAPATAMFTFMFVLLLMGGAAWAAIARGYVTVPIGASERIQDAATVVANWLGSPQPPAESTANGR
ncbi:MAG: GumC family protein [Armatimonadota bacterium]